ncbi:hypothetical protein B484DRAFT_452700 [Ochromonadaceae sp. CCMP2298]|nr:hypothetical protein B484DRAFT_452700 [Ochromonadaceae sp. CCMP2298]|mmetsp:Transcript_21852/g.48590  ORF Transcript_21852/g.48590 Transcript_21852/m.48590 type:complete len:196 (+) Transcript_21852:185-772(+)
MASFEEDGISKFTFAVDRLSEEGSNTDEEIAQRLDSFKAKYMQMLGDLQLSAKRIEDASRHAEAHVKSAVYLHYGRKFHAIHHSMTRIDKKILEVQKRLNVIRKQMPQRKHSLVETGPFTYKCVAANGAHYRDFPSTTAKVINENALVACDQEIEIAERVFIASEQSVFLHCRGYGWLFENRREEVCFVRVAPAF